MVNGYGYDALKLAVCKSLIDVVERQEYDQNKEYEISPLKLRNADSPFSLSRLFSFWFSLLNASQIFL